MNSRPPLVRTRDRKIAGVSGGIARQFNIDPTVVRILAVLATIVGVGSPILIYLLLWVIMPAE